MFFEIEKISAPNSKFLPSMVDQDQHFGPIRMSILIMERIEVPTPNCRVRYRDPILKSRHSSGMSLLYHIHIAGEPANIADLTLVFFLDSLPILNYGFLVLVLV